MYEKLVNLKAITGSLSSRGETNMRSVYIFGLVLWRQNGFEMLPKLVIHPRNLSLATETVEKLSFYILWQTCDDEDLARQILRCQTILTVTKCATMRRFFPLDQFELCPSQISLALKSQLRITTNTLFTPTLLSLQKLCKQQIQLLKHMYFKPGSVKTGMYERADMFDVTSHGLQTVEVKISVNILV